MLLPHRTPEGAAVIYYGVKSPVSGRYTPISMKIFLMLFEMICKENPPTSLILLYDFKNVLIIFIFWHIYETFGFQVGLMNLATVKISYVRNFINYLQEGLPLTLKKIYVLNVTSLMSFINSLAKPFMKPEIFNKVRIATSVRSGVRIPTQTYFFKLLTNIFLKIRVLQASTAKETLHQEIGIEFLPKELEGKLPTIDNLQDRTTEKLREMYHFFEAEQQQRRNC